jgi:hypothetical protein
VPSRIRIFRPGERAAVGPPALDGFLDALLQKFENCRDGLSDEAMSSGEAEAYFAGLYEPERARLREIVRLEGSHLPEEAHQEMYTQVDRLVREVVLPAYVRLTVPFTRRERNGFFLAPERLHAAERVGWAIAGTLVGVFVVWAPFIPLWSKEWVLPFFLGGLVLPELRRWWELRRYEAQLNRAVVRADAEVRRIDVNQLVLGSPEPSGKAARRALAEGHHGERGGT